MRNGPNKSANEGLSIASVRNEFIDAKLSRLDE